MGNCLSKYPQQMEIIGFRNRRKKGSTIQNGPQAELKARSLGARIVRTNNILTPVNDRFPPQAFNLVFVKFEGITTTSPLFRNPSCL